jgi:hypothetical protein
METIMQVRLCGIVSDEVLEKINTDMSLALIDAIALLPMIDRKNVYLAHILEPAQGDYPYRVGYEQDGQIRYWAGETLHKAVNNLRDTMSPAGIAEMRRMNIPMPGEVN